ncbi:MAG: methionine ABC transporter substrate-binding protein, partial [Clostridia bacterium]|nr:methionine ABC transporter substrate-binding protein [Clostridia bacterium]
MKIRKLSTALLALIVALSAVTAFAAEIPAPEGDDNKISIGVTVVPHEEIVENVVQPKLEEAGWML